MFNKKQMAMTPTFILIISLLFYTHSSQALVCFDRELIKTGTPVTEKQARRMLSDATFKNNQQISKKERIRKVKEHMQHSHSGLPDISDNELAELIVDIADCTGHDFSIFAGLLRKESDYCLNRLNTSSPKSTASGCGQITIWPVKEFKNHLNLPGKKKAGDADARASITELTRRCLSKDRTQDFLALFSKSPNEVKKYLRSSGDYEMDLFVAALYLKFHYGRVGFYYNPHSPNPGALSLYGEGSQYAKRIERFAGSIQKTNQHCIDDSEYIQDIESFSCEISNDPAACSLATPTFEI